MPLYEGIALIQEKQAVVLDLGYEYTKCGFAGEAAPRCIIRSEFWSNSERRIKSLFDYTNEDELYENLVDMLHLLYFKHVLINPKERKVVVIESLLTPTLFRETLAKVLFLHYEVPGASWAEGSRLSALTVSAPQALVIDIGYRDAEVNAVVHGCPILRAIQSQPLGAKCIHKELAKMIDEDNNETLNLPESFIEDIKVKTCFVGSRERFLRWQDSLEDKSKAPEAAKSVKYPLVGRNSITISGRTRELACSRLFARDNEMSTLPDIILQCIMQCPIDSRRPLAENILLTGGGASLPGLKTRVAEEIKELVKQPPYSDRLYISTFKFHSAPAQDNSIAWLGASLAGSTTALISRALTREIYIKERRLRDWVCLLYNTPRDHHHFVDIDDNRVAEEGK